MVLSDEALARRAKELRHRLAAMGRSLGTESLLASRDVPGDVGTTITTPGEAARSNPAAVAAAAAARAAESLRCIEEYGKLVNPDCARQAESLRYELYRLEQAVRLGGPRRRRLASARLHVLITESLCRGPWLATCEAALAGGADVLQLREKQLGDRELLARARALRERTAAHGALLIINDRPDIARLAGADGVHLGTTDMPPADARSLVGPHMLIGATAHSLAEAAEAIAGGADYLGVGTMFASPTKPDVAVQGPGLLAEIGAACDLPLVAIGGITSENVPDLIACTSERIPHATGRAPRPRFSLAVCQAVLAAPDPAEAVRRLRAILDS